MKIMNLKISLLVTSALVPLVLTSVAPVFAMEPAGIEGTADIARPAGTAATTLPTTQNVKDAKKRKAAPAAAAADGSAAPAADGSAKARRLKASNLPVAAATGSAAPAFSIESIKTAVQAGRFNQEKGNQNCLECAVNFIKYIRSEGTIIESAANTIPEANIAVGMRAAFLLVQAANEEFGTSAFDIDEGCTDLSNPKTWLDFCECQEFRSALTREGDQQQDLVGIIYRKYKQRSTSAPKRKAKALTITGHFLNVLFLNGKLWYVDAQNATIAEEFPNARDYDDGIYYKTFPLSGHKAASAGEVFFKQEPGTSSSSSSSSSSSRLGRAIKQEGGLGGAGGAPVTREDEAGESPSRFTEILQELETATEADAIQFLSDMPGDKGTDNERALMCVRIFKNDNLNLTYRSRVSIALKLRENKALAHGTKVRLINSLLHRDTPGTHLAKCMPHVPEILGSSDVTRKVKAEMIVGILRRDTPGTHLAECMPHVPEILGSGDVANQTKAIMIADILRRDQAGIQLEICMPLVQKNLGSATLVPERKATMISNILACDTHSKYHEIYEECAIALLSHEQVTAESKTKIAALMLRKDSFKAHHADIQRRFPKLAQPAGGGGGGTTDKTAGGGGAAETEQSRSSSKPS